MKITFRLASLALTSLPTLVSSPALAQSKAQPRRLESGELRANFRTFESGENIITNRQITASNNCPDRVQIGGSVTPADGPQPLRIENKTAVIDSKIAVFCGI